MNPNTSRKYLVQFELSPETRWLFERGAECNILRLVAENVAAMHTTGPRPKVTVTEDERQAQERPSVGMLIEGQCKIEEPFHGL